MPNDTENHISWLENGNLELTTQDGVSVKILEFLHKTDEEMLTSWAKHFREHYCADSAIDELRSSTGLSRADYLNNIKFPDKSSLGAATRVSDFSEILIADYLNYSLNYLVPRTRYDNKNNRNSSPQGIDVVGFKVLNQGQDNPEDELITCEVKAALGRKNVNTMTRAIEDSKKDYTIKTPEALNAIKQRLRDRGDTYSVKVVERFQNQTDRPYKFISSAGVVHSNHAWDDTVITGSTASHPNSNLLLIAIKGEKLLELADKLYERARDGA